MCNLVNIMFEFNALLLQVVMDLLIDPALTGCAIGKLKITNAKAVQPTTSAFTSHPNFPILKGPFLGRYFGSRRRHIKRAAGKAKEMISVSMAVPTNTVKASENKHYSFLGREQILCIETYQRMTQDTHIQ